jgi:gliding motility-associated protein GldE
LEIESDSLYLLLSFIDFPFLAVFSFEVLGATLLVLLLLYSSAMISGSEVAFFSLTPNDLAKLEEENSKSSTQLIELHEKPRTLLATILIANNFINIAITLISDFIVSHVFSDVIFNSWAKAFLHSSTYQGFHNLSGWTFTTGGISNAFRFSIVVLGVTFFLVLFGEVAPKIYAKLNNVRLARTMTLPLSLLMKIFAPVSMMLVKGTNLIENRLVGEGQSNVTSKEEIGEAIELTVSNDSESQEDVDILKGIVKFGEVTVTQIMRARVDVEAIDFKVTFSELLTVVRDSGYSRIPVYEEDFDHVTGILYVKDLLGHLHETDEFEWQSLIRTNTLYVPETKKIDDLLKEFQTERRHMAIVVDEYGGTSGIVTLEDIMEEIIGEIRDEFDDIEEVEFTKIDDFNFIFEGKTMLNDVCRIIGVDTETFDVVRGESDSVAGMILEMIGFIPKKGREVNYEGFRFKVESVSKRRIEQILITLPREN